ncbi:MAG: SRPBCC family protein [Myxococcales bacterium]
MSENSVVHGTFTIERTYKHTPAKVFAAFHDPRKKRRWFAEGEGWEVEEFKVDFRVNGFETSRFRFKGGPEMTNHTLFTDIVPDRRIIVCYTMAVAGKRISSSLGTTQFIPVGSGTKVIYTEQVVFLDGADATKDREAGSRELFEALERELNRED